MGWISFAKRSLGMVELRAALSFLPEEDNVHLQELAPTYLLYMCAPPVASTRTTQHMTKVSQLCHAFSWDSRFPALRTQKTLVNRTNNRNHRSVLRIRTSNPSSHRYWFRWEGLIGVGLLSPSRFPGRQFRCHRPEILKNATSPSRIGSFSNSV